MLKLMGKKILTILRSKMCLSKPVTLVLHITLLPYLCCNTALKYFFSFVVISKINLQYKTGEFL